jgi:hypothetical protein
MPRINLPDSDGGFAGAGALVAENPAEGKTLVVTSMHLMAAGAATVRLTGRTEADAGSAVDYMGPYPLQGAGEGLVLPYNPDGWGAFPNGIRAFLSTGTAKVVGSITYETRDTGPKWT